MKKRGQLSKNAGPASVILILMGVFIFLYLSALQPEDRRELIEGLDDDDDNNSSTNFDYDGLFVLNENPGSLYPTEQDEYKHPINQIVLSAQSEDRVLVSKPSLFVETSKLNRREATLDFDIDSFEEEISKIILTFNVEKSKGRAIILLNGKEVFNGHLDEGFISPIELDTTYLNSENEVRILASGIGWDFWNKNYYELRNVKLIAATKDLENQKAYSTVILSGQEVESFDSGVLRFVTECTGPDIGTLKVFLNGHLLSSKKPTCRSYDILSFTEDQLVKGRNELAFELSGGTVYLTNLELQTSLKEPKWPIYFFEINETIWEDYEDEKIDFWFRMKFIDGDDDKQAQLNINDRKFFIDTDEEEYEKKINSYVIEDDNYIKLIPETDLDISYIRVEIEEEDE